ncbi:MAG: hypothetical protein OEV00_08635, partial [Acidobacteriota bacterium]|nr:hypothetical protein [Acidobacteriota bacterium]
GVPGTADYQVARSSSPEFDAGCVLTPTTETILVDAAIPVSGAVFFYLNRPLLPTPGSWGKTSAGAPRAVCGT